MITRRSFLGATLLAGCWRGPLIRSDQPRITHGVQAGDVTVTDGAARVLVWSRCSEPATMLVELAHGTSWTAAGRAFAGPDTDCTAVVAVTLPLAGEVRYRVRFEREAARGASDYAYGQLRIGGAERVRFVWTGDTCGQGYGRNPEFGGLVGYRALRAARPDFFLNSGDLIYADNPILAEQRTPDGRIWKNITNERVGRVAQELDDFRARFAYNLEDEHVRALAAEVPVIAAWDDHETHNNWWPGQQLDDDRYTQRDASALATLAKRAMFEWVPLPRAPRFHRVVPYGPLLSVFVLDLRSFRTPNDANTGEPRTMLGSEQVAELVAALRASRARWKVIACSAPISLVIGDGPGDARQEGYANGAGPPRGREHELAALLAAIDEHAIDNVVWLTADVHYAAHHHYDPARSTARVRAFHEFVAGPIHAGTFGPNALDPTFGPEVRFQWAPPAGTGNLAPWDGLQSFGIVDVTRDGLRVALVGIDGRERYHVELPAV